MLDQIVSKSDQKVEFAIVDNKGLGKYKQGVMKYWMEATWKKLSHRYFNYLGFLETEYRDDNYFEQRINEFIKVEWNNIVVACTHSQIDYWALCHKDD